MLSLFTLARRTRTGCVVLWVGGGLLPPCCGVARQQALHAAAAKDADALEWSQLRDQVDCMFAQHTLEPRSSGRSWVWSPCLRERCACSLFGITNRRLRNQQEALLEAEAAYMADNATP